MKMTPRKTTPLRQRFAGKHAVDAASGCWLWNAAIGPAGYGRISIRRGVHVGAHRVSWELHRGPIPDGALVLHRCDTPACVNPDHLFLGTHDDNMADRQAKSRQPRGEQHGRAKLSLEAVHLIRQRCWAGERQMDVAAAFGIGQQTVSKIVRHVKWATHGANA